MNKNIELPEDWEVKCLDSISTEVGDGIHTTPKYVKSSDYFFINGNNLFNGEILITEDTKCVCEQEYNLLKKNLNSSTILISINGTIGNLAYYKNEKVVLGKSVAYVNIKKDFEKRLIFYLFQHSYIKDYFKYELTGTTINNLSLRSLRKTPIPIPPTIREQNKIASILSTVDDLIENTDYLINSYTLLKKSLMQILLIKGIGHTEFKETDLGEIPVNWEIVKLGLIVELKHGYQFRENDLTKSGIPIIKIGQISNNRKLDFTNITFIDENRLSEFRDNLINNDDVLISLTGNIGRVVIVKNLKGYAVQNYRVGRFIPDETKLNKQFLVFILESNYIYQQFNMLSNKTAQANFGKQDINKIKVLLPPIEEQQKISFLLSLIDKTLENYEYENEKLIELKQGLMQQLLTGKIRVRV